MRSSDWFPGGDNSEDITSSLHQRTEEVYQIPDSVPNKKGYIEAPVLILNEIIVLPKMISPIMVSPGSNLLAIQEAQHNYQTLVSLVLKNPDSDELTIDSFLPVGVEMAVGRLINLPDGNSSALVQGRRRLQIVAFTQTEPYLRVRCRLFDEKMVIDNEAEALMRATRDLFEKCIQFDRSLPEEAHLFAMNINEPGWLADMVATAISLPITDRQQLLLETDPLERLKLLNNLLAQELDLLQLEDKIQSQVQSEVDKNQREFYLREQLKAIQNELGEGDVWSREVIEIREKLSKKMLPQEVNAAVQKEIERLTQMPPMTPEVGIIRTYIDWILELPWHEVTEDNLDVNHAKKILDDNHYALTEAKDRILEYIAVRSLKPKRARQPILCFVGPPGTGKTSLGKSIADALGRKFVRLSLGGVRDEAEIRGHRRTYIGAMPGRIIQTMKRAKTMNPLFMLDEIDKLGADFRGDPASALLEVLDPEQNSAFSDHYLELDYDLSNVMFITTANTLGSIPPALIDRMELIEFPGYYEEEKLEIARRFLISRQLAESSLEPNEVNISEPGIRKLIREYTYEAGVRNLEREIGKIFRKTARLKSEKKHYHKRITEIQIEKFLGPPDFQMMEAEKQDEIGVATAIAWTESGGEIMPVEVLLMDGKGSLQITGQVGDIMQESAQAALSYLKSRASELGIDPDVFEQLDVHIHVPEGAIPKDGPSAGITIASSLISAFTLRKIYKHVGMTGEITLRGKVLPVGGIREKVLAAHRSGLKMVLMPERNKKDLNEIPKKVRDDMQIVFVSHMDQVLELALEPAAEKKVTRTAKKKTSTKEDSTKEA